MDERQEALVVTAKAYLARGVYIQYDDSRLVAGNVVEPPVYRWSRHRNGPEDSTRQHTCYTNCAAFCYDVYKQAFDLDIKNWCTEMLIADGTQQAFRYEVQFNETDEQKELVEKAYVNALQPGDIIVDRHVKGGGHAMLYVGDGKIIHSSAPGGGSYNYDEKFDKIEETGSIHYMDVKDLFTPGMRRYTFTEEFNIAIIRPLQLFKDAQITESTKNRVARLQNIFVEKLCSRTIGQSVAPEEELTFTYYVRNDREEEAQIEISDVVPAYTEYLGGGNSFDGKTVRWEKTLDAGEEAYFEYTVKVKKNAPLGEFVASSEGKVNGVSVRCPAVEIGYNLCCKDAMENAALSIRGSRLQGMELAREVYKKAGVELELESAKKVLGSLFVSHKNTDTHFEINPESPYYPMLLPTMYGGRYVANCPLHNNVRTAGVFSYEIMAGDLILTCEKAENDEAEVWVFTGESLVRAGEEGAEVLTGEECGKALMSLPGYYKFALIRPTIRKCGSAN